MGQRHFYSNGHPNYNAIIEEITTYFGNLEVVVNNKTGVTKILDPGAQPKDRKDLFELAQMDWEIAIWPDLKPGSFIISPDSIDTDDTKDQTVINGLYRLTKLLIHGSQLDAVTRGSYIVGTDFDIFTYFDCHSLMKLTTGVVQIGLKLRMNDLPEPGSEYDRGTHIDVECIGNQSDWLPHSNYPVFLLHERLEPYPVD